MKKKPESSYGTPTKSGTKQELKESFIYEVLGQQQAFKKHKTKQNLTKLIEYYRKLVQHYDEKNDKISIYFHDKMQSVSAEMPSLQGSDEKVTMSMAKEELQQEETMQNSRMKQIITTTTPVQYDPDIKRKERSKNAQIAIQVNKVKKKTNARTILNSYYDECVENNRIVEQDLKNQRKQLEQKLIAIRNNSAKVDKRSLETSNKEIII